MIRYSNMPDDIHHRIRELIAEQHGVVTRKQLFALGLPRTTLDRRIARGSWTVVGGGVLAAPGTPDSLATRSRIAALRVPDGILTGPSVAALRGGDVWNGVPLGDTPWLIHPRRAARAKYLSHPGVRRSSGSLWRLAVTPDAVLDAIRLLRHDAAMSLAYRAVQRRVLSLTGLLAAVDHFHGYAGHHNLAAAAREIGLGTRSEGERRLRDLAELTGESGWRGSHRVMIDGIPFELDLALPELRLYLEMDGYAYHSSRSQFVHDRQRHNTLATAGWSGLRFSWFDVTRSSAQTIATIRAEISRLRQLRVALGSNAPGLGGWEPNSSDTGER